MTVQSAQRRVLNYRPCRYGTTRVDFRGPKKRLNGRYVAFLGGTETYGKFISRPFPDILEERLGLPCVNFGLTNAGVDVFLNEPEVLGFAARSEVTVIQILGAQNMSNRFYRVHPRRNDRFVAASQLMRSVFHDVDFSEFNFTRHMLSDVSRQASERFSFVREELRAAWCARMQILLERIAGRKLLLWFADHPPPKKLPQTRLGRDPLFIDRPMIETLRPLVDGVVQVRLSEQARLSGTEGMRFRSLDQAAAAKMLGPLAHEEAANALYDELRPLLMRSKKKARR
ncbi:DUF6473 family protein [Cognatishimia activa]|uniref:DUF6473 domain-containing protein n=1 Tax=Cognatishimia activa TaxID=1715691 RepID=A0A0N7MC74_9RHOB|nr:DUF6473 family protein [Cognatishimia activa]CUI48252.1 hypothetical protein TA5113_00574 [Cognatishimia activa]CUK27416.1 hypothetical protein TA5114_03244 [Cognatishimia activa]